MSIPEKDIVFIKDLVLEMSVGIYDHEKQKKQRIIINIEMTVLQLRKGQTYTIENVVSYENIVNRIMDLSQEKHFNLLEELAEKIARECLKDKRIISITVRLEKPDIIKNAGSVGIQITQMQPH